MPALQESIDAVPRAEMSVRERAEARIARHRSSLIMEKAQEALQDARKDDSLGSSRQERQEVATSKVG